MIIDVIARTHDDPAITRRRRLERWQVHSYPARTPGIIIHELRGYVTMENVGAPDEAPPPWDLRIASTSPIAKVEGEKVTTASGSTYWLGQVHDAWAEFMKLQGKSADAADYVNTWIQGDNWRTI